MPADESSNPDPRPGVTGIEPVTWHNQGHARTVRWPCSDREHVPEARSSRLGRGRGNTRRLHHRPGHASCLLGVRLADDLHRHRYVVRSGHAPTVRTDDGPATAMGLAGKVALSPPPQGGDQCPLSRTMIS